LKAGGGHDRTIGTEKTLIVSLKPQQTIRVRGIERKADELKKGLKFHTLGEKRRLRRRGRGGKPEEVT